MRIVAYGGGLNSTAMLLGCYERGISIDHITFADTGGERPETYEGVEKMRGWLVSHGMPDVVTVRRVDFKGDVMTLEDRCLKKAMLPSLAYGFKKCSEKFKIQPQDKYFNNLPDARAVWKSGQKIEKLIGYDADEGRRVKDRSDDPKYTFRHPLIEWDWGREECEQAIRRHGLGCSWAKSSCFFCPHMKAHEIRALSPELKARALAIEDKARPGLTEVKGLGRRFAWRDVIDNEQQDFMDGVYEQPCGCYDGGAMSEYPARLEMAQ